MSNKMWGGRFSEKPAAVMAEFEALDAINVWLTEVLEGWTP